MSQPTADDLRAAELTAYALGELPADQADAVAARIADDPRAQADVAAIRATAQRLGAALASIETPDLGSERRQRIAAQAGRVIGFPWRQAMLHAVGWSAAAAAAVAVIMTVHQDPAPARPADLARAPVPAPARADVPAMPAPITARPDQPAIAIGPTPGAQRNDPAIAAPPASPSTGRVEPSRVEKARELQQDQARSPALPPAPAIVEVGQGGGDPSAARLVPRDALDSQPPDRFHRAGLRPEGEALRVGAGPGQGQATATRRPARVAEERALDASPKPRGPAQAAPMPPVAPGTWWQDPNPVGMPMPPAQHGGETYRRFIEQPFLRADEAPLSTFGLDVDTASYAVVRRFLTVDGRLPPPEAVRVEELLNAFRSDAPLRPAGGDALAMRQDLFACPWSPSHRLLRVQVAAQRLDPSERPAVDLVFLVDVSGSMAGDNRLPLVRESLRLLVGQLRPQDTVAIVTYAGSSAVVLAPTAASERERILAAIGGLQPGGGTNGEGGIRAAYELARSRLRAGAQSRVVLCTDGDFNVGVSTPEALRELIRSERRGGVLLTAFGFGMGNLKDTTLGTLAAAGDGSHAYIDSLDEARQHVVDGLTSTLITVAKDVKVQVEFNPRHVTGYRLIGYDKRPLAAHQFTDDSVDSGEISANTVVTALYQIVPAAGAGADQPLRYSDGPTAPARTASATAAELGYVRLRWKPIGAEASVERAMAIPLPAAVGAGDADQRFAAAVAGFGLLLRGSAYAGRLDWATVAALAEPGAAGEDPRRREFRELVIQAARLSGQPLR